MSKDRTVITLPSVPSFTPTTGAGLTTGATPAELTTRVTAWLKTGATSTTGAWLTTGATSTTGAWLTTGEPPTVVEKSS